MTAAAGSGEFFDTIADRYDLLNRLMSGGVDRRWRRHAVEALALGECAGPVLDVATGTGDLAIAIARTHGAVAVVGVDPSVRMLERARAKVDAVGIEERVRFETGDACALPFDGGTFAGTAIAFGIRNVPDRPRALAEMARVTRPGGRVVVLELGEPRGAVLGALGRFHVHSVVPRLGALLSGARAYRYLEQSIAAFPPPDEFAALMAAAGLAVVEVRPLTLGACTLFVAEVPA